MNIEVFFFDGHEEGKQGVNCNKKIGLLKGKTSLGYASSLTHEITHEILHQQNENKTEEEKQKLQKKTREIIELEAEAIAYVVMKHFHIDLTSSCNYLAVWKANKERLKQCFEDISSCASKIIEAIYRIASSEEKNNKKTY